MHNTVVRPLHIHRTLKTHYKQFVSDQWLELNFEMASTISKIPTGTNKSTLYPSNGKSKKTRNWLSDMVILFMPQLINQCIL